MGKIRLKPLEDEKDDELDNGCTIKLPKTHTSEKIDPEVKNKSNDYLPDKTEETSIVSNDLSGIKVEISDIKQRIINLSLAVSSSRSEIAKRLDETSKSNITDVISDLSKVKDQLDTIYEQFSTTNSYIDSLESSTAESIKDLEKNIDIIKLYIDSINKHVDDIPTKKTICDLWDKDDVLNDLKKALNELKSETNRLISNSSDSVKQSIVSDLTQQINRLKEVVGNVVKSSVSDSINNAVSAGVESGISKSLKSSAIANDIATSAQKTISQEVSALKNEICSAKIWATESSEKGTFNSFTITYALIIIISGIFAAFGYFAGLENLALLGHTLWNVLVSLLLLTGFNILYALFGTDSLLDADERKIYRIIYYIVVGVWSVCVTLIPSLIIIGQV